VGAGALGGRETGAGNEAEESHAMNTPREPRRVFVLRLEGRADNENAHVRTLKFILKHLLRARSLKCIDAREIHAEEEERS